MTSTYPFQLIADALDSARITAGLIDVAGITAGLGGLADAAGITAGLGGLADAAGITIGLREQMAATMGIWTKDLQFAGDIADRLRNNTTSDIGIDPTFSLTRSQQRFLFGLYIYILVSSLVLWTLLDIMIRNSEADSAALTLIISMTGLSSHAVARKAREMAYQVFDQIYPNEK